MNQTKFWQTFQHELTNATNDISKLRSEITDNDTNAIFFLNRLMSACENTTGCVLLAKANLGAPLGTVARSLFESLVSTFWASLDDENANYAKESEASEYLRIIRNTLREGTARIIHKKTGKIENDAVLNHPDVKKAKAPKKVFQMAEEAGLKTLYVQIYGVLSIWAHGTASQLERKPPVYELMSLVWACLKAVHLIAANRIREGKQTPIASLEEILKVRISP